MREIVRNCPCNDRMALRLGSIDGGGSIKETQTDVKSARRSRSLSLLASSYTQLEVLCSRNHPLTLVCHHSTRVDSTDSVKPFEMVCASTPASLAMSSQILRASLILSLSGRHSQLLLMTDSVDRLRLDSVPQILSTPTTEAASVSTSGGQLLREA